MMPLPPPWFPAPTMADLRAQLTPEFPLSTGWPAIDALIGGFRRGETYAVEGPPRSRRRVLARLAAWAGGDGYRVTWVGSSQPAPRMKLQVLAAGIGCAPAELETATELDDLLDEAIRRIHVLTVGSESAPERWLRDYLTVGAPFDVLVVDDFTRNDEGWVRALTGAGDLFWTDHWDGVLRLAAERRAVLVLAGTSMRRPEMAAHIQLGRYRPDTRSLGVAVDTPDLQERTKLPIGEDGELVVPHRRHASQPAPGDRPNLWQELCERRVGQFAAVLGATPIE